MPLTDLDKVNQHLPEDKAQMDDSVLPGYLISVTPVVLGMLSGTFSTADMNLWVTGDPPDLIEEAVARIVAGMYYNKLVSEEEPGGNDYANKLYAEGMAALTGVKDGTIILPDVTTVATSGRFEQGDFYPDSTVAPKFTMGSKF